MPRLPEATIVRLKTEISLLRLIESQGYTPKKQGKDYVMTCPWHDDKTPSLIISPDTNLWSCKGACQTGGSVIDWVMKTQGVSFRHACEILQKDISAIGDAKPQVKKNTTQPLAAKLINGENAQEDMQRIISFYHDALKHDIEGQKYLEQRGLNDPELIETFKLGLANRTLGYQLPAKNRAAGKEIRTRLQEIGILRQTGHEHFSGSLVVPVIDESGVTDDQY